MTQPDVSATTSECLFGTILGFMLPFFLTSANGDPALAKAAVVALIEAYNTSTPGELDLAGRIIGFSVAAMDNLRLSATAGMSDTKVLRYRCNAVTLTRAADQARKILDAVQAKQEHGRKIPRPSIAAAPPAPAPVAEPRNPQQLGNAVSTPARGISPSVSRGSSASRGVSELPPLDIEMMKRDARILMQAFSKNGAQGGAAGLMHPDPTCIVRIAPSAAVAGTWGSAAA